MKFINSFCKKLTSAQSRGANQTGTRAAEGSSKRALFRNTTAGRKTTRACSGTRPPVPLFPLCMFRNTAEHTHEAHYAPSAPARLSPPSVTSPSASFSSSWVVRQCPHPQGDSPSSPSSPCPPPARQPALFFRNTTAQDTVSRRRGARSAWAKVVGSGVLVRC